MNTLGRRAAAVLFAILLLPADGLSQTQRGAAQPATPAGADLDVPAPEECRIAPRPTEEVHALVRAGYAAAGTPTPPPVADPLVVARTDGWLDVSYAGQPWVVDDRLQPEAPVPPADEETARAVAATLRELAACDNAGDIARDYALHTTAWYSEQVAFWAEPVGYADNSRYPEEVILSAVEMEPRPAPPEERRVMSTIVGIWQLPDGRTVAVAIPGAMAYQARQLAAEGRHDSPLFYVLALVGERWLIDKDIRVIGFAPGFDLPPLTGAPVATPPATPGP